MAYVPVPKDLTKVKTKVAFNRASTKGFDKSKDKGGI